MELKERLEILERDLNDEKEQNMTLNKRSNDTIASLELKVQDSVRRAERQKVELERLEAETCTLKRDVSQKKKKMVKLDDDLGSYRKEVTR